jgi:HlyD family secretion protein
VKIANPDDYLRPEMNASVAFISDAKAKPSTPLTPVIVVPSSAVKNNSVFIVNGDRAVQRSVKTGPVTAQGIRVESGLNGGEDLIVNPPADLKEGAKVRRKQG